MLNTKIKVGFKLKAFHPYYLDTFVETLRKDLRDSMQVQVNQTYLPKKYERFTLLKSPHVDKKARDQYERTTHKRLLTISFSGTKETLIQDLKRIFDLVRTNAIGVDTEFYSYSRLSAIH